MNNTNLPLNTIKTDVELGKNPNYQKYIYKACPICGKPRWVRMDRKLGRPCLSCAGKQLIGDKNANWRGGIKVTNTGYISLWLQKDSFFYPMAVSNGRILEHRLVMAQHLHRCLLPWEIVHHINGIKSDNRLENLALIKGQGYHNTQFEAEIKRQSRLIANQSKQIEVLQARVTLLEAERVLQNANSLMA